MRPKYSQGDAVRVIRNVRNDGTFPGENTGSLDRTLGKAAEYLDKELPRKLKQVFTLAEVTIIVLLGGMVAVSALAMLLPIFSVQSQMMK